MQHAPRIKICGITTPEALEICSMLGVEYVGFVFAPGSPRLISPSVAQHLAAQARGRTNIVALLVNAKESFVQEIVKLIKPNILQLHAQETPHTVAHYIATFGVDVIKALPANQLQHANAFVQAGANLLIDSPATSLGMPRGGTGEAWDLQLLPKNLPGNWFLAGGLNINNVANRIAIALPWGVDVSSGVESSSGVKDIGKIQQFVTCVRTNTTTT